MWAAAFDTVHFNEAVSWFRQRTPITDEDFASAAQDARAQAFWIAGVAHADIIRQVHESLGKALEDGVPFEQWKDDVAGTLKSAWGSYLDPKNQPDRIETILRNWAESSYNRARWSQMGEPAIVRLRPYRMFDAVRDARTSEICEACDGTVLPFDHPWWETHQPPLHHRCRSGVRALTTERAKQNGVTGHPTDVGAQKGFGTGEEWAGPDPAKYPRGAKPPRKPPTPRKPQRERKPKVGRPIGSFRKGIHAKQLHVRGGVKADEILSALQPSDLKILQQRPLNELTLSPAAHVDGDHVNGWYSPFARNVAISGDRQPYTFGHKFTPGAVHSVSTAGTSAIDAAQRTLIHELAHHVHLSLGAQADELVIEAYIEARKDDRFITNYARFNHKEYFAESFAAYRFHRAELKAFDPRAYALVEKVLALHGV